VTNHETLSTMSWNVKRPSAADTEEDLLRQQEAFLQGHSKRQNGKHLIQLLI
jgi:hypothetical protein